MKRLLLLFFCFLFAGAVHAADYRFERDILYRTDASGDYARRMCRLDVACPPDAEDAPVVVWFHGGGLTGGKRAVPEGLMKKGFVVVGVGYRLIPHVGTLDIVDDAAAAVAWVFDHIADYGGSPSKIYIAGHSAGGYLVNMVGLAQFLPEITQKRLKLTLHLPDSRRAMMLGMLGYGLVLLTMLFAVQLLAIGLYLRHLMAPELVHAVVSTTLPWYAAGFAGYLFAAWICIEPTWRQRLFDALIAAGVMRLLFSSDALRVCDTLLPWIAAVVLCALFFPLHSTLRFRRGCQD